MDLEFEERGHRERCCTGSPGSRVRGYSGCPGVPMTATQRGSEVQSDIPVHWRSPSVLGEPAVVTTTGYLPAENALPDNETREPPTASTVQFTAYSKFAP